MDFDPLKKLFYVNDFSLLNQSSSTILVERGEGYHNRSLQIGCIETGNDHCIGTTMSWKNGRKLSEINFVLEQ